MSENIVSLIPGAHTAERRFSPRRRMLKGIRAMDFVGKIMSDGFIRNLSRTGAMIELHTASNVPNRFDIEILSNNVTFQCQVIWRTSDHIGVVFTRA